MTTQSFNAAALVNEICVALGKDFYVTKQQSIGDTKGKYGCWAFVVESPELGNAQLLLRVEEHTSRIESQVTWPLVDHRQISAATYVRSEIAETVGGYPGMIGVSYKRGAAAIVADMRKRLIPRIVAIEPLVREGIERERAQMKAARQTVLDLADALGYSDDYIERRAANGASKNFPQRIDAKSGALAGSATFEINEVGTVSIKLTSLTKAQAQAVIKALNLNG